ncbi:MAG: ThuA domain-containing protein [Bryobacterales bacterium]|nr:ThuA domain-containing protein [Bryobacterales bacterium]
MRRVSLLSALIVLTFTRALAADFCDRRVLIVTGQSDEPHHHWRETTAAIRDILSKVHIAGIVTTEEPRGLTAEALKGYQAVVLNYNGPRLPRAAEQALESFVEGGGGLFAFHLSAYGPFFGQTVENGKFRAVDNGWAAWPAMIGATWEASKIGHAPRGPFEVRWNANSNVGKYPPFLANDELYHRLTISTGTTVEATALSPAQGGSGQQEPIIWTNRYGKGRVFFTTLGHDAMAFHQPGLRSAVVAGVQWAMGSNCVADVNPPLRMLAVTQGHSYPTEFYAMLNSLGGVKWTHATSHAEAFRKPIEDRFDVVLLHDMLNETPPETKQNLRAFVEAGKGVVSIHHAIVNYTDWPWWYEEVIGGKYFIKPVPGHEASHYREGVDYVAMPVAAKRGHPVLKGVGPLTVHDEVYRGMWLSPRIDVLMETNHPENDRPLVYIGPHPKTRSVFIQLGHSGSTMDNPGFRQLVRNAVQWAARRTN